RIGHGPRRLPAAQPPLRGGVQELHGQRGGGIPRHSEERLMLRVELDILQQWIAPGSRVLDLGCGDGTLLDSLTHSHGIEGYGLEIDPERITACIAKGVNVIETDINKGLAHFPDKSFETVLMTNSLQALMRPDRTIEEMLRIGRECVVTFPNFGNIRARTYLGVKGQMPVTKQLSYQWYDTPN